jgi:hypothetical protein
MACRRECVVRGMCFWVASARAGGDWRPWARSVPAPRPGHVPVPAPATLAAHPGTIGLRRRPRCRARSPRAKGLDALGDVKAASDFKGLHCSLLERWLGYEAEPVIPGECPGIPRKQLVDCFPSPQLLRWLGARPARAGLSDLMGGLPRGGLADDAVGISQDRRELTGGDRAAA